MDKKRACPTCGAYLREDDKVCYVCGEVLENTYEPEPQEEAADTNEDVASEEYLDNFKTEENYSEEYEEPYYEEEEDMSKRKKRKSSAAKKTAIICSIIVAVALAVAVCVCFANGIFAPKADKESITLFFDKPASDINLIDENGIVYNWGSDVNVVYTVGEKTQEDPCKLSDEIERLWMCEIPADAQDVYFVQSSGTKISTEKIAEPQDKYVYYVTEILLDESMRLKTDSCPLSDFRTQGINSKTETEPETEATTEKPTETEASTEASTEATTQAPTSSGGNPYRISVPSTWSDGTVVVTKGNCTSYYESYNYKNYQCGMLVSIYVVDSSDTSYSEMKVKKVINTSDGQKKIVVVTPSDIEFNDSDDTASENYVKLSGYTDSVIASITAN